MFNERIIRAVQREYECTEAEAAVILELDIDNLQDARDEIARQAAHSRYCEAVHQVCYEYLNNEFYAGQDIDEGRLESESAGLAADLIDNGDYDWTQIDSNSIALAVGASA